MGVVHVGKTHTLTLSFPFPNPSLCCLPPSDELTSDASSLPPCPFPSLSFFQSLSLLLSSLLPLPLDLSFSLLVKPMALAWSTMTTAPRDTRTGQPISEAAEVARPQLFSCQLRPMRGSKHHSPATLTAGSCSQWTHLNLLFKMVSSIFDESVEVVNTHFCVKTKTLQVDLSQTKLYFEVTIPNSYSWWKILSNGV